MKRAVAYLRVSTDDQKLGPEAQRSQIEAWAQRERVEIVSWHEDHTSGATAVDLRDALPEALAQLRPSGAKILVVAKRDRIARDLYTGAMIERLVKRSGAEIVSAAGEGSGGDGPDQVLLRRLVDVFAEYERLMIQHRTRAALAALARRGERNGEIPYGCKLGSDGRRLEPHEGEQTVIRQVLALVDRGRTQREIARILTASGVRNRQGGVITRGFVVRVSARRTHARSASDPA